MDFQTTRCWTTKAKFLDGSEKFFTNNQNSILKIRKSRVRVEHNFFWLELLGHRVQENIDVKPVMDLRNNYDLMFGKRNNCEIYLRLTEI